MAHGEQRKCLPFFAANSSVFEFGKTKTWAHVDTEPYDDPSSGPCSNPPPLYSPVHKRQAPQIHGHLYGLSLFTAALTVHWWLAPLAYITQSDSCCLHLLFQSIYLFNYSSAMRWANGSGNRGSCDPTTRSVASSLDSRWSGENYNYDNDR